MIGRELGLIILAPLLFLICNLCYPTQDIQRTIQTIAAGDSIKMTLPGPINAGAHNEIQNPGSYGGRSGVGQYGTADSRNLYEMSPVLNDTTPQMFLLGQRRFIRNSNKQRLMFCNQQIT